MDARHGAVGQTNPYPLIIAQVPGLVPEPELTAPL
jgi:hypothetical protein